MKAKKGIIIFAIGHVNYYRMAENLAASLLCNGLSDSGLSVAVLVDDESKLRYPHLFNQVITLPSSDFTVDGKIVFNHATVRMYEYTPFDVTIKLDADMIWIPGKNPADLFSDLQKLDIAFETMGSSPLLDGADKSVWADVSDIKETYGLSTADRIYKIYGEFLYFKKGKKAEKFFNTAKQVYFEQKVKCYPFSNGTFTDELAFQIACMQTGIYPHAEEYTPVYNIFLKIGLQRAYPYQLGDKGFYGYSIGGNRLDTFKKEQYNLLALHYFNKLGLSMPYKAEDKRTFLQERKQL